MTTTDMILPLFTKLREDINARFDAVDRRFDAVDRRFDVVDQRFDAVDRRFELVEDRFEQLEHHAAVTNRKLDAIHARLQSTEVVRDETWAQVAATAAFLDRTDQRNAAELAELRARIERLEAKDRE